MGPDASGILYFPECDGDKNDGLGMHLDLLRIPQSGRKNVKTFRWHHRLQSQNLFGLLQKSLNASRPSEHPPVRGENGKTFRWDHRLQIQNLFMALKRVPQW